MLTVRYQGCWSIVKGGVKENPITHGNDIEPMDDDMYKAFTGKYDFDYKDAIKNAVDCDKSGDGGPDLRQIPSFDDTKKLPKCLVNLKVERKR